MGNQFSLGKQRYQERNSRTRTSSNIGMQGTTDINSNGNFKKNLNRLPVLLFNNLNVCWFAVLRLNILG